MRTRRLLMSIIGMAVVAGSAVILLSVNGKQVSNVFSNISNGLGAGGMAFGADNLSSGASLQAVAPDASTATEAQVPAQKSAGGGGGSLALGNPPGEVERTVEASYVVPHNRFEASFKNVIARAVDDEDGFVVSSSTQPDSTGRMVSGTVVVKIPAAKLSDFLDSLPTGTFSPSSINFGSIDHTSQFIDSKARLGEAQQELDALKRALSATSDPATINSLTQQISDAQTNLEKQQAAFNVVQQSVDLSTATMHLKEAGAVVVTPKPASPIFVASAQGGWNNDITILSGLLYAVLTALPLLVLLVIIGLQRRRLVRWAKALVM